MSDWLGLGAVAMCLPAWFLAGRLAQQLKLPSLTGYLVAGAISGPSFLQLLRNSSLANLGFVDHACLGVIALAAGAELKVAELKRTKRQAISHFCYNSSCATKFRLHNQHRDVPQVLCLTLAISVVSWLAVTTAAMAVMPLMPFMQTRSYQQQQAVASLIGTLAIARSPASAVRPLSAVLTSYVTLLHIHHLLAANKYISIYTINFSFVPALLNYYSLR